MLNWLKNATNRNITGNYKFHIKSQPQIIDNSTTIIVTPFSDRSQTAIVPCHYRWFRLRNGIKQQSYKYKGNSYVCDSADIGAIIVAQVLSNDPQYSGQATVQFGPVKLSVQIKKNLMDTLANGSTLMRGFISLSEYQEKQCDFKIFQDMIKIRHLHSQINYSFIYSPYQPRIQSNPKDPTKLSFFFSQNQQPNPHTFMYNLFGAQYNQMNNGYTECRLQIRFVNKQLKQLFLLTLKAFFTKKQLKNSVIINKIQQTNFNQKQDIDLLFEIQSLKSDVTRLYTANEAKQRERLRLSQQVNKLQRQMQEIVTTYTRIADDKVKSTKDLNQSYALLYNKKEDVFGRKCQNLQRQNMNLNERIKLLSAEIDQIRVNSSMMKKNQTINPNFTQLTAIRIPSQIGVRNQVTTFENILENLNESKVSNFNEQNFKMSKQLQKATQQKSQLQRKLQKSFRIIDDLQKKLKTNNGMNQSAVYNFHKKQFQPQINTSSYSLAVDMQKIQSQNAKMQNQNARMQNENSRLIIMVDNLKKQNINLKNQVNSGAGSRIIIKPQMVASSTNQMMKTSMSMQKQSSMFQNQNQNLKKQITALKQSLKNQQAKTERYMKDKIILQRKVNELQNEISMLRRNQEMLNSSQHFSEEMESYSEQKIKILQQNNNFLINENQKLSKAVEKFMIEAKENIKLRKQLLQLKQKLNQKLLNPQKQSKSVLSCSANNMSAQYSEVMIGVNKL